MFYKMIENKCTQWYESERCTVKNLIEYIEKTGQMRDAQIEAIKVYLFLKIACECKPLTQLFRQGFFNSIDLNEIELSKSTREYLFQNPAAATLFEYACLTNDKGEQVSEKLEKQIKKDPTGIDYNEFFRNAFYGVSYTDYLFSLPMGAGKTYLMAAFIYLDLYFAYNEPTNPSFAHNFIIFAPSGLKSSVVPSLKTIQNFNPSWILPEPAATDIKRMISFEVLDQSKTAKKSNKTKNPNVQKIANHQPLSELFGLVAVTNAEKVILERIQEKQGQINMFEESEDDKDRQANELRNLIGKLPSLSIFIDEVHHAVSDEIKLRAVVTRWAQNHTVNSVIGFSGTPYLDKVEKIKVVDSLSIGTAEITNIVYYYPLIDGVGNFLKRPVVKIADIADSSLIIEKGVREFLDTYKDTVYADGLTAKLGIYCGTIEKLEETVYPQVSRIVAEYGLGTDVILKFHKGNKQYKMSADSQMQFDILDKSISEIRIVLLVQIGKEGWDCRSLTGIILSQEGDCPTNMVLQTSCRCLRQVIKNGQETALIYLNESNAEKLNMQLERQHHISLKEFSSADNSKTTLKRYNRTAYLKLPKVELDYFGKGKSLEALKSNLWVYRNEIYENGDPDSIFYVDILVAVIIVACENSSWSLLPSSSGILDEEWESYLQSKMSIKMLWPAQRLIAEKGLLRGESSIVQLPTGVGKTRSIELIIRAAFLSERANIAIIVAPLRALCNEITMDMYKAFGNDVTINQFSDVLQNDFWNLFSEDIKRQILICTPEKLSYVLHHDPFFLSAIQIHWRMLWQQKKRKNY